MLRRKKKRGGMLAGDTLTIGAGAHDGTPALISHKTSDKRKDFTV